MCLYKFFMLPIIFFFFYHSNQENPEDGSNPVASKLIRRNRKRHQKEDVNLLEATALKFRKLNSKLKKKVNPKELKKTQTLPYEILQLEEVIGSQNSLKIKLYTLSNEHLGYPSDLRANFPFDPATFFLKIHHSSLGVVNENIIYRTIGIQTCTLPNIVTYTKEIFYVC